MAAVREIEETVYTANSLLRQPGRLLRGMFRDLQASWGLAWRLLVRDISAQYRQTVFGYVWAILPPLVTGLVFILLGTANVIRREGLAVPYPAYVMIGTVFFGLFMDALTMPLRIITTSKYMLAKVTFPREALIIAGVGQVLFGFAIKLVVVIGTLAIYQVPVKVTAPLAVVPVLTLLLLGTLVGVTLAPISLLYHDVAYGLSVAGTGLMLLTPAVYVPPRQGLLAAVNAYNPLTPVLMASRELLLEGIGSSTGPMLLVLSTTIFLLFLAWVFFRLALPILVERVGA